MPSVAFFDLCAWVSLKKNNYDRRKQTHPHILSPCPATREVWVQVTFGPFLLSSGLCLGKAMQAQNGESGSLLGFSQCEGRRGREGPGGGACGEAGLG